MSVTIGEGFWPSLLHSATFWNETALFALACAGTCGVFVLCIWNLRRRTVVPLCQPRNERGVSAAVDFTLTLPIIFLVVMLTIQFALLANASFIVHYAAYQAARAARVHLFDASTTAARTLTLVGLDNALTLSLANKSVAEEKALDAARLALISIGSAKKSVQTLPDTGSQAWQSMQTLAQTLAQQEGTSQSDVFVTKASYVFDRSKTEVEIELDTSLQQIVGGIGGAATPLSAAEWPVNTTVRYQFLLTMPGTGRIFGTAGADKFFYRQLQAEMSLL